MQWRERLAGASVARALVWGGVLLTGLPAGAGTLYRWQTENGSLAFADDPKRIPERYRESAEQIQTEGLDGYSRYTPADGTAQREQAEQLTERLDGLRERSGIGAGPADEPADDGVVIEEPRAQHPVSGIALESTREAVGRRLVQTEDGPRWRRTTRLQTVDEPVPVLGVTPDPNSDEPVVVERIRARSGDSFVTRHITVVRQGDRVLSIIKPRSRLTSSDFPLEEDFER